MKKLKLKTKPYPHQIKAMRRALKKGSYAFYFEPRLGKTKTAIDTLSVQFNRGNVKKVAVLAPIIALDVWVRQLAEHCSVPYVVHIVDEDKPAYRSAKGPRLQFFLANYDKYSRRGDDHAWTNSYVKALEHWGPDCIVLDESHRVKSSGAVRSQSLWRMVARLRTNGGGGRPFVYLLTGTPNPKGWIDLFSQFRILDERIFGTSRTHFEDEYCIKGRGNRSWQIRRYRNVADIQAKVDRVASIVSASEAGLAGEEFFLSIPVDLPFRVRTAYEQLAEELIAEIEGEVITAKNAGVRRLRLLQLTGGFTTAGAQLHKAKLEASRDFLSDLCEQGENVVVYCRFLPEVHALRELCKRLGFHTQSIYGAVKRRDRDEHIRAFQAARDGKQAIVFQATTGSLAIELTNAAEVHYYSLPDGWEAFYQGLQRVKGPKQTRPVRYSFCLATHSVDISVLEVLREKRDMHKVMMRSPRDFLYGL